MAKKIKTEWNFGLLYKSENDPQIEKDIKKLSKDIDSFVKKYGNDKSYLKSSKKLLKAMQDNENIYTKNQAIKPLIYLYLKIYKDSNNEKIRAKLNKTSDIYSNLLNKLIFFHLDISKIPEQTQKKYLKDPILKKYKFGLEKTFERARYKLSEPEEKIMNLMIKPAKTMWSQGVNKVLNKKTVKFKRKEIPLQEAVFMVSSLDKKDRKVLHDKILDEVISVSDFAEAEMNAVIATRKINDDLRGYKKPYSATVKDYSNEDKTVENLIKTVNENMKISHKFFTLKAKLLKLDKLGYEDRMAKFKDLKTKFTFKESIEILRNSFEKIDPKYRDMLDRYLENGNIDVYPKKGKRGGAFCMGNFKLPTFVMLNHTNDFSSLITFAHEIGHAFHSELSQKQPSYYYDYSTASAEVASTFFENFVFDEVFGRLSDEEKIIALHDRINNQVSTVFRQVACFNFENEMHLAGREKGYLSSKEIANIMNKNMKKYLGPKFKLTERDGYYYINWPHIRRSFYVYSYAFGSLISDALYLNYKKDKKYIKKVEEFLSAGGSKKPEDIFKDVGINIRNPKFFKQGLVFMEENIKRLEKLVKGIK